MNLPVEKGSLKETYLQCVLLSVFVLFPLTSSAMDYSTLLKGKRLVMRGCEHCGIEFTTDGTLLGYAESAGEMPVFEYQVRWLSENLLLATQKGRNAEGCPPRVLLYKVERMSNGWATIRVYWTGWPQSEDDVSEYRLIP